MSLFRTLPTTGRIISFIPEPFLTTPLIYSLALFALIMYRWRTQALEHSEYFPAYWTMLGNR